MTFLAPGLLALGAAVLVPLLLHLLHRHRAPRLVFPAIRYLRRAEREHATRIRLRQLALLALRMLGILLLAAAAARPFVHAGGGAHEPTAVVLVLDNSLSSGAVVGDHRVLDDLKAAALETLAEAGPDDRFWLIRAGAPWEPAIRGTATETAAAVRATAASDGAADLAAALARARGILQGSGGGAREIHVLSDLQATELAGPFAADSSDVAIRVLAPAGPPPANRAVTGVELGAGLPPRAGERSVVSATLAPGPDPDSTSVRLVVDQRVRAVARAAPGASVVLPFPAHRVGPATGRVEIDRDALAADDQRWFSVNVAPPPSVAASAPLPFLDEALAVLADAGRIRLGDDEASVVVAPGGLGADRVRRGAAFVIVPPASSLEREAANRRLAAAGIPWRLDPPDPGETRVDTAGLPLASVLGDIRLRQVYRLVPVGGTRNVTGEGDSVLVRLRSGEPWVVAGRADSTAGRYVLLATPLTVEAGTLPTSAAMLPLLDRAITVWAAPTFSATSLAPGDAMGLADGDSVMGPDGRSRPVEPGQSYRFIEAGIHRVMDGDRVVAAFAVNPPAAESDLTAVPPEEVARRFGGDVGVAGPGAWSSVIYHRRLGQEATMPLIVVALAVLLLESAVAAAGRPA